MKKNQSSAIGGIAGLTATVLLLLHAPSLAAGAAVPSPSGSSYGPGPEPELLCDVPFTSTLDGSQTDQPSFSTGPGEIVSLVVERIEPSDPGFSPEWRLVKADGTPAVSCGLWNTQRAVDCGPLPSSGSPYHLQVRDQGQDAAGTYKANLQRLTAAAACDQVPQRCGEWLWSPINDPTDSDLLELTLADQDLVTISVYNWDPPGPAFQPEWRLLQGDGSPAPYGGEWTSTPTRSCGPLPATGSPYRVEVRDAGQDYFGICHVGIESCTGSAGVPGSRGSSGAAGLRLESSNPVTAGGRTRVIFGVDVTVGSRVTLDVADASGRIVARPLDRILEPGRHSIDWNAGRLPGGIYMCRLHSDGGVTATKLVLLD